MKTTTYYAAAAALASTSNAAQFVMYTPGGDSDLVERADAIVAPGKISAHVHQIFGASNAAPDMTYESLQKSDCTTVGSASGEGNGADKSVYWHPSLYAEAADGSGYIRIPNGGHKLYYRDVGNAGDKKADPFEFPKDFHMVAGDQTLRAPNSDKQHQLITEWLCHTSGGIVEGQNQKSGFPKDVSNCDSYPGFAASIHFPHCWNGEAPKVNDNTHMSYPEGDVQAGPCPSSHPIRVPHIFMENFFDLKKVANKIKPNTFVLSQGDPTGYGFHADFFNGWDQGAIPQLYKSCPQPYYGNSDIGTCPSFKPFPTKNSACKLKQNFKENCDSPGQLLPGCNPINTHNPAPKMLAAALGVCSTDCQPANGGATSSNNETDSSSPSNYHPQKDKSPVSPPTNNKPPTNNQPPANNQPPTNNQPKEGITTTLSTAYSAPTPASHGDKPAGDDYIEYVTAVVTVTVPNGGIPGYGKRDAAPTPVADLKRHEHLHRHKRQQLRK